MRHGIHEYGAARRTPPGPADGGRACHNQPCEVADSAPRGPGPTHAGAGHRDVDLVSPVPRPALLVVPGFMQPAQFTKRGEPLMVDIAPDRPEEKAPLGNPARPVAPPEVRERPPSPAPRPPAPARVEAPRAPAPRPTPPAPAPPPAVAKAEPAPDPMVKAPAPQPAAPDPQPSPAAPSQSQPSVAAPPAPPQVAVARPLDACGGSPGRQGTHRWRPGVAWRATRHSTRRSRVSGLLPRPRADQGQMVYRPGGGRRSRS
jgi:outer membrane biosynthesis protein TonB